MTEPGAEKNEEKTNAAIEGICRNPCNAAIFRISGYQGDFVEKIKFKFQIGQGVVCTKFQVNFFIYLIRV